MSSLQALAAHMLSNNGIGRQDEVCRGACNRQPRLANEQADIFVHVHLLLWMIKCCSNVQIIHLGGGVTDLRDEIPPAPAHHSSLTRRVSINLGEFWMSSTGHLAHGIQRWHTFCGCVWAESPCPSEQTGRQCENV